MSRERDPLTAALARDWSAGGRLLYADASGDDSDSGERSFLEYGLATAVHGINSTANQRHSLTDLSAVTDHRWPG